MVIKNLPANAGNHQKCGFNSWVRKIPQSKNGNPLQCCFLENSKDRGAWQGTVCGVTKTQTGLSMHSHT